MSGSSFPAGVTPDWVRPNDRKAEYLIISELTHWVSHWDPNVKRARRCGGPRCYWCSMGCQKQLRVVVMLSDRGGRDMLLELRERHREVVDGHESVVGLRVSVKREGTAQNSPVTIKVIGSGAASERDISRLVESLGLPPTLIGTDEPDVQLQTVILDRKDRMGLGGGDSAGEKLGQFRKQFEESADRLSEREGG